MNFAMWRWRMGWPWAVLAAAWVLAGCGGGGGGSAAPGGPRLTVSSSAGGSVTSTPAGISCGTSCTLEAAADTAVTLAAAPEPGFDFAGWGGACSGTALTCTVTMDQDRTVSASFTQGSTRFTLGVTVAGSGSVQSQPAGIDCGSTCSASYAANSSVVLTAVPAGGQSFQGWSGACSGQAATCTVTMNAARAVGATFVPTAPTSFALEVTVTGSGVVSSQPAGIQCGSNCTASFAASTSVVLTATPSQGQVLQGWGGACAGSTASCTVTMSAARSVAAFFVADAGPARAWGTATLLESSNDFNVADTNTFASAPVLMAIDSGGNALVLWEQSDGAPNGSTKKVYSRRYVAGQGWAAAVVVPGASSVTGRLLMDETGTAAWIKGNFETRRYSPAGGWSTSAFVPAGSSGGQMSDAAIDAAGNIHMLGVGGSVLYSRLAAGTSQWTAWADVSKTTLATNSPQLALGSQGSLIAVWRERNPGDTNYSMKANRAAAGTWQTPVRIEEGFANVNDSTPRIASDANGNAVVAWHQADSLYVNRFDATAGTWGTAVEVDAGQVDSTFSARIQLAMTADGRAVVGWNSGTFALKAMTYDPGTGFSAPVVVNSYSSGHFLGIDRNGRALAVYRAVNQWPNPTDASQNVYSRELSWGGAWSASVLLETGAGDVKANVPCALNGDGQAACAWAQDDVQGSTVRNSLWSNLRR